MTNIKKLIARYEPHLIFFVSFTLLFFIVKIFFIYLLPFIIGIFVAFIMYPVYSYMKNHLSFKPAFSATVITLFIFLIIISIFSLLMYLLISESVNLIRNYSGYLLNIFGDTDIIKTISDLSLSRDLFSILSDTAMGIFKIIPITITLLIISFTATVTIINKLSFIKRSIFSKFSTHTTKILDNTIYNAKKILQKFFRSYLILYLITFIESVFVFCLVDVDYPLVFAFLASIADLLPVLGPGTVYLPIAVIKLVAGDLLSGISLIILWIIISVIRQIIEPKIVSDTIKIHPLVILSALYFSIISSNIWVLVYISLISVFYKVLVESGILTSVFFTDDKG